MEFLLKENMEDLSHSFEMTRECVISTKGRNLSFTKLNRIRSYLLFSNLTVFILEKGIIS